jgi:hypothetical protein
MAAVKDSGDADFGEGRFVLDDAAHFCLEFIR